jgi:xylose dehydrogenase (NAD/NADP)
MAALSRQPGPVAAVRWGFLGAGAIACDSLAPAVHAADGAVLEATAARDPARAAALGPRGRVADRYDAVLEDPRVDAVYIALANDAHLPWTVRALEAGKHVLCAKPLGLSAAEVSQMTSTARRCGRLLVEALWYWWHPRTRRAAGLVADGALAQVHHVETAFCFRGVRSDNYRWNPRMGGGALHDVGPCAVSAAVWALARHGLRGEPRIDVSTGGLQAVVAGARLGPSGVDLTTTAELRSGDSIARVTVSMDDPGRQAVVVTGDAGRLIFEGSAFTARDSTSALRITIGHREQVEEFAPMDPYRAMVEAFSRRVRGEDAEVVSLRHSLAVASTCDGIRAAALVPSSSQVG